MRTLSGKAFNVMGLAVIVMGLAIIGPVFVVQATTEVLHGFLRVNPSDEVAGIEDVDHRALATTSDQALPMCDNGFTGVQNGDICCLEECGTCGGAGCGRRPGGSEACCTSRIRNSGSSCSDVTEAPCFIDNSTCSNGFPGIQTRNVCCLMECGRCGGVGCAGRPGGKKSCCTSEILASKNACPEVGMAPCFIEDVPPTVTPSVMPTATPSPMPTATTVIPSVMPTAMPSFMPTPTPSVIPTPTTAIPSVMPTPTPSVMPTPTPSVMPTEGPSFMPTATPSVIPTVAVSTCSNGFPGFQNGIVCCAVECGFCGGEGCFDAPGGPSSCCTGPIVNDGEACSDVGEAPCLILDL